MSLFASCPVCGLSVQVLSLETAGRCRTCAVPLTEAIPVAERATLPAARPAAQGFDWTQVSGIPRPEEIGVQSAAPPMYKPLAPGWATVHTGLTITFAAVVLYVLGLFAIAGLSVVLGVADVKGGARQDEAADRAGLVFFGLGVVVSVVLIAARFMCCSLRERRGNVRALAWAAAVATVVSAAASLLPTAYLMLTDARDVPGTAVVVLVFVSMVVGGVAELLFMMFVREVGRVLRDAGVIAVTGRFFWTLGVLAVGFVIAIVAVPLAMFVLGAFEPAVGVLLALAFVLAFAAIGVMVVVLYLMAVAGGRAAIGWRLREEAERSAALGG